MFVHDTGILSCVPLLISLCMVFCVAQAEARKEALEEERALLETSSKGSKAKPAKGKAGKK